MRNAKIRHKWFRNQAKRTDLFDKEQAENSNICSKINEITGARLPCSGLFVDEIYIVTLNLNRVRRFVRIVIFENMNIDTVLVLVHDLNLWQKAINRLELLFRKIQNLIVRKRIAGYRQLEVR